MNINKFEELIKGAFERDRPEIDTDAIWENIEPQLKKKKKRRAFIIFFWGMWLGMFLLLLWKTGWKPTENTAADKMKQETSRELVAREDEAVSAAVKHSVAALKESSAPVRGQGSYIHTQSESAAKTSNRSGSLKTMKTVAVSAPAIPSSSTNPAEATQQNQASTTKDGRAAIGALADVEGQKQAATTTIPSNTKTVEAQSVVEAPQSVLAPIDTDSKWVNGDTIKPSTLSFPTPETKGPTVVGGVKKDNKADKFAKNEKKKPDHRKSSKKRKFQFEHDFGVQTGPAFAIKQLRQGNHGSAPAGYLEERKSTERSLESFTAGIFYSGATSKGLLIKTGLEYRQSNEKFHMAYNSVVTEQKNGIISITVDGLGNTIEQTSGAKKVITTTEYSNTAYNHYRYVDFPVGLGYRYTGKRSRWELSGGVDMNLYFRAKGTVYNLDNVPTAFEYGGGSYETLFTPNPLGIGLWGSYAYDWRISDKWRWQLSANAQIPLNPVSNASYKLVQRYFNFGISAGVLYQVFQDKKHAKKRQSKH